MARELRIRLLGQLAVEGTAGAGIGSRKARTLLKVLALARGAPVAVDTLTDILWGDALPAVPADQLSVLVSRLRSVVGAERLTRGDEGYSLRCDWLDVDAAAELLEQAASRLESGAHASARAAVNGCLALLRGPLLPDEPDAAWAGMERARVERMAMEIRHIGAETAIATGDHAAAIDLAEAVLDRDPYDERAVRQAMTAQLGAGRPAAALRRYEGLRRRLANELGVDPSGETRALHLRILQEKEAVVPWRSHPVPERRDLPGRADALAALDAALGRARTGVPQVVSVEGEAGIGKTELIGTWAPVASASGAVVLRGQCDGVGGTLSLQPVFDALQGHLRAQDKRDTEHLLAAGGSILALLLDWRTAPADPQAVAGHDAGGDLVFASLLQVIGRIAAASPLVLIFDDVHLAGSATADWVSFARRHGAGLRLLVVVARRPEEGRRIEADVTVKLGPLDLAATRKVVGDDRADELHRRSGGNPLFLVELAGARRHDDLPSSLREAVSARCERAGPAAPTLRNAAVIGPVIDLDLLAAVTRQPAMTLLDHLEEGVRRGILEEGGDSFRFRHALVREALAASASPVRQALLHREAGRALAARPQPDPLTLAHHARLSGEVEVAAAALMQAGEIAATRFDHASAEGLLDEAMALRDSAEGRLARARIRVLRGRYDDARDDARAARSAGGGARAVEMAGAAAYYRRELAEARDLADEGLDIAVDAPARAACLVLSARALHALGDLDRADQRITEAVSMARSAQLPAPTVVLGMIRIHQGRAAEALDLLQVHGDGLDASAHSYATFSPLHAQFMTAYALATLGRADDALRRLNSVAVEVQRLEAGRYGGLADAWRGWILRQLGSLEEADECNRIAAEAAARAGYMESEAYSYLDLMEGRLLAGDLDAAASRLRQATDLEREEHAYRWRHRLRSQWLQARLRLQSGEAPAALELSAALQTDARRLSSPRYEVLGRLLEARARAAAGEPVTRDAGAADLLRLGDLAGLEAWWLTAEHAHELGVEAWWQLAEGRVNQLAARAGVRADAFRTYAAARLEEIRTSSRQVALGVHDALLPPAELPWIAAGLRPAELQEGTGETEPELGLEPVHGVDAPALE